MGRVLVNFPIAEALYWEVEHAMNKNNERIDKLEREIWLFEQWSEAIHDLDSPTQQRIYQAYQECIASRRQALQELQPTDQKQRLEA